MDSLFQDEANEQQSSHLSEYARVSLTPKGITIATRSESGRGKRFGTTGSVELDGTEAIELTRYLMSNVDMSAVLNAED